MIPMGFRTSGYGEQHYRAVLTEEIVLEARKLHSEGWSNRRIADKYAVNINTIHLAITGMTWKHIDGNSKYRSKSFNRRTSKAGIDKIMELHAAGYNTRQIGIQLKLSHATVLKYIRQNIPDIVFKQGRPRKKK